MDVSEITKVASRKRLNVDAEKLREKVSRETAKIIKLKVAQDTAYWDLKEKLHQVEGNHERLQQNMVEVQMQHEAISGQYQDELRLRPDTLNKLSSTREICDVLEEYSERLKDTLSRCKNDQASLCDAYQKSGKLVRGMKRECERAQEKRNQHIQLLHEKVAESTEYQEKLIKHLTDAKQQSEAELYEIRNNLSVVQGEKQDLLATISDLNFQLDQAKHELLQKDEAVLNIHEKTQKICQDQSCKIKELEGALAQKEAELKEASEAIKELRGTVANQEEYAGTLRAEHDKLLDQLAAAEGQLEAAEDGKRQLETTIESMKDLEEDLTNKIANITTYTAEMEKASAEKEMTANAEREEYESQIARLNTEKDALLGELENAKSQCSAQTKEIDDLQATCHKLREDVKKVETAFKEYVRNSEDKISELKSMIDEKEKDVSSKAGTIAQLMCEVGTAGETTARLETALQKTREESELERQAAAEREGIHKRQIDTIQTLVSEKENELSKQMTIILDMRSEKDRLQEKIQTMQNKIDNIQKELSEPHPRPPVGDAPELDDNALAFAPTPRAAPKSNAKPQAIMKSPLLKPQKKQKLADNGKLDSMLFSMFSDTSMDEDSNMIDRHEVDRRFEALARGEPLPPTSINSLKRRKAPSGGLRLNDDEDVSLSQIKKSMKSNEPRKFFKNMRAVYKK